jgi:hypothetical protein
MSEDKFLSELMREVHRYTFRDGEADGFNVTCNDAPALPPIAYVSRNHLLDFSRSFDDVRSAAISMMVHLDGLTIRALVQRGMTT